MTATLRKPPRLRNAQQRTLERELRQWLRAYGARVVADVRRFMPNNVAKQERPRTEAQLLDQLRRLLIGYGVREMRDAAIGAGREVGERIIIPESFVADAIAGKPIRIKWLEEAVERGDQRAAEMIEGIRDDMRRTVQDFVGEQREPSMGEVAQRLRERFTEISDARATLWARTEEAQATNTGIFNGYMMAGVEELEWSRSGTGDPGDRRHDLMDGVRVKIGEMFVTPLGNRLRYPGDPLGPIKETANCSCVPVAHFGGE